MQVSYNISYINDIIGNGIICRENIKKGSIIWLSKQISYDDVAKNNKVIECTTTKEADILFENVWSFIDKNKNVITFNETNLEPFLVNLSSHEKIKRFLDLSYGVSGEIHYIMDDGKYMNHSDNPNCYTVMETATTFALRDIEKGEILTEDYSKYTHPEYLKHILKKYECEPDYYSYDE